MLLLVRLFMVALSWFVGYVTWVVLFEFTLTEESKQSRSCVTSVALPSVARSHDSHKDEEWCKSTHQSEYDFLPRSKLYIMFNLVVVCFIFFISSLYEDRIANCVQRALNSWKSKRKAERKDALKNKTKEQQGKDIKWIKKSIVHRDKLEKLVETLKYKPVQTIGVYNVCFENSFVIGYGNSDTKVFVGLGTDGVEVAIKRLNSEFTFLGEHEKVIMNLPTLQDNPYVLTYRFHIEMEQYACLVTDLQDGSLKQFIDKSNLAELQNKGPTILRQILLGIDALHDENILHRDLKPENVLVNFEGKMVLGDFGICRQLQPDQTSHSSVMRGTEGWMAVESLPTEKDAGDPLPESEIRVRYRKKSDVQVLGMLFYFVLTKGKHPFGTPVYRMVNIIKGMSDLNDLVDADAKDLIQWMLQKKITERPTVKQCLKHPYFMSPEQKFRFLTAVGNEVEIKKKDHSSNVVRELNQNASLTTPPWWEKIDKIVLDSRGGYVNNVTDLLRFIRNLDQHFYERKAPRDKYSTPQAALLPALPELPMVVYQVVRKYPSWCERDTLKDFF